MMVGRSPDDEGRLERIAKRLLSTPHSPRESSVGKKRETTEASPRRSNQKKNQNRKSPKARG